VEAEKKLEEAVGGNGLMLSQTTTTSGEERLRSLQDELTRAQADRIQKEAQNTVALGAQADTLPGVQDNPEHRAYEVKLADLNNQLAQVVPALTEQNPKVIRLRSQIADAEAGLLRTQTASTRRQDNEYSAARHREALLMRAYAAQQSAVSSDLQKATKVTLLRKELDSEQQLYQTLLQRAKEAGFASAMQAATIRVVDAAKVPDHASSPRRMLASCIGLLLGSLGGIGLAFFRERNDRVFRAPGDIPRYLNVQELGVIPTAKKIKHKLQPAGALTISTGGIPSHGEVITLTRWGDDYSIAAEAYRNATLSILLDDTSQRPRSYVVSSPSAGEGKTTIVSNLGVALSKSRLRVVLIDGDLRRPALHRAFGMANSKGLRNILRGEIDLQTIRPEALAQSTSLKNISIIPAGEGSEDVVELLHSAYFGALLGRLSRDFDVVLIDTPPITHMADARILARHADGAILVFRAGVTTRDEAADARDRFDRDGVRLVGTLLNDFDPQRDGRYGYYSAYLRYQDGSNAEHTGVA
jgi:succinoglycan biosynthesis transport protein ExoP